MNPFSYLFSFLFPVRCVGCGQIGAFFCGPCTTKIKWVEQAICPYCKKASIGGRTHFVCQKKYGLDGLSSGFYFQGPIKKAVYELKYRNITTLQARLVELLAMSMEKQLLKFRDYLIVPIPLYKLRERKRGFNQAKLLGQGLALHWDLELTTELKRVRNTTTQVALSEKERLQNLKDAFAVVNPEQLVGKKVILVDDVFTTGATLFSAAEVLKKAGIKQVWGVTLARAQSI